MARIFLSYRRSDSRWVAGRLYDRLGEVLGRENVFLDVSDIEPGEDFVAKIGEMVGTCDALLVIIGPSWLSAQDAKGARRLDNPLDLIRVEVGTALQRNIRVIPVLVDDVEMPRADELPEDLAPLARRNARELSFDRFHADVDSVVRVLTRILGRGETARDDPVRAAETSTVVATALPFTISIETLGGVASPVFQKGASLPAVWSEVFSTAADNQSAITVRLCLGEKPMAFDNVLAGTFDLTGIPAAPRGVPQIALQAKIDTSLVLTVTAEDLGTGHKEVLDAVDLTRVDLPPEAQAAAAETTTVTQSPRDSKVESSRAARPTRGVTIGQWWRKLMSGSGTSPDDARGDDDLDLRMELPLSRSEAAAGADKSVAVDGKTIKVKVPAGLEPGSRLRLRGLGLPKGDNRGDLYLYIVIRD